MSLPHSVMTVRTFACAMLALVLSHSSGCGKEDISTDMSLDISQGPPGTTSNAQTEVSDAHRALGLSKDALNGDNVDLAVIYWLWALRVDQSSPEVMAACWDLCDVLLTSLAIQPDAAELSSDNSASDYEQMPQLLPDELQKLEQRLQQVDVLLTYARDALPFQTLDYVEGGHRKILEYQGRLEGAFQAMDRFIVEMGTEVDAPTGSHEGWLASAESFLSTAEPDSGIPSSFSDFQNEYEGLLSSFPLTETGQQTQIDEKGEAVRLRYLQVALQWIEDASQFGVGHRWDLFDDAGPPESAQRLGLLAQMNPRLLGGYFSDQFWQAWNTEMESAMSGEDETRTAAMKYWIRLTRLRLGE